MPYTSPMGSRGCDTSHASLDREKAMRVRDWMRLVRHVLNPGAWRRKTARILRKRPRRAR